MNVGKTVPLVITCCTKRKRGSTNPNLRARLLDAGSASEVASSWSLRVGGVPPEMRARDLYAGRGHVEALRTAEHVHGQLAIISAGLGLVDGDTSVPVYSLTTSSRDPDDVRLKTASDRPAWWAAIQQVSPFPTVRPQHTDGLILAAVSSAYLDMIATEWSQWPSTQLLRLRLFSKAPPAGLAAKLLSAWMPYDDRLDDVASGLAGTQGDFAQRAMRHFATTITSGSPDDDAAAVRAVLEPIPHRAKPVNQRLESSAIKVAIRRDWEIARGQSSIMLRHLRDTLGLACEQGRFKTLFNEVKAETSS